MSSTYQGIERRSHKRVRMNCTVIYRLNEPASARFMVHGEDIKAKMLDISQAGMALVTDYNIPTQTQLSLRFTLLKVDKEIVNFSGPVEVTGEVKSNIPAENKEHRLGIYFTKVKKLEVPH
ncbi:MAG: PilZ domain-containing protein [Candidatus Omnitrophota bacterium]